MNYPFPNFCLFAKSYTSRLPLTLFFRIYFIFPKYYFVVIHLFSSDRLLLSRTATGNLRNFLSGIFRSPPHYPPPPHRISFLWIFLPIFSAPPFLKFTFSTRISFHLGHLTQTYYQFLLSFIFLEIPHERSSSLCSKGPPGPGRPKGSRDLV